MKSGKQMEQNRHCACVARTARRWGCQLALALGGLAAGPAHAGGDEAMKLLTVGGSLASWAWVALQDDGQPWNCRPAARLAADVARDGELRTAGLGAAWRDCALPARVAGQALTLQPWLMAHGWQARGEVAGAARSWDIAAVPLLRGQWPLGSGLAVGVQLGIGLAWLADVDIGQRHKSTHAQFSDHLGLDLGPADGAWRLGLAWRHVSNGDLRKPNNAVDLLGLRLELPLGSAPLR